MKLTIKNIPKGSQVAVFKGTPWGRDGFTPEETLANQSSDSDGLWVFEIDLDQGPHTLRIRNASAHRTRYGGIIPATLLLHDPCEYVFELTKDTELDLAEWHSRKWPGTRTEPQVVTL